MNKVILSGVIATPIESKGTTTPMAKFNLAVKRMKDGTDFVPIVAWNQTAENVKQFCDKGSRVIVEGRIQINEYEKDGQKRTSTEINADRIEFFNKPTLKQEKPITMTQFEIGKQIIEDDEYPWN